MKKFYFTFGSNHTVPFTAAFKGNPMQGRSLGRWYVTIEAEDEGTARQMMFNRYSDKWAFCYHESDYQSAIKQFNLSEFERLIEQPTPKI